MKKIIPATVIFLFWAIPAIGSAPDFTAPNSFYPAYFNQSTEQSEKEIEIFPNPVTEGRLTIKSAENFRSVQILNITGEIVFSAQYPSGSVYEVIELNKLEKGIYLVRIGFAEKVNHTEKIMIK